MGSCEKQYCKHLGKPIVIRRPGTLTRMLQNLLLENVKSNTQSIMGSSEIQQFARASGNRE